jgi:hypothetical protein
MHAHPTKDDATLECGLIGLVAEARSVHQKFGQITDSYRDIADTLNRAAAQLRAVSGTTN